MQKYVRFAPHAPERLFAAPLKKLVVQHPLTSWLVGYAKRRRAERRTILRYKGFWGEVGVVGTSARFAPHAPERLFAAPLKKLVVQHPLTSWLVGYAKRRRAERRTILRYKGFWGEVGVVGTSARFAPHAPESPPPWNISRVPSSLDLHLS